MVPRIARGRVRHDDVLRRIIMYRMGGSLLAQTPPLRLTGRLTDFALNSLGKEPQPRGSALHPFSPREWSVLSAFVIRTVRSKSE
jgi:hypothetical protein